MIAMAAVQVWGRGLRLVFSTRRYMLLFAVLLAIFIPLYALLTNMVILSPLSCNPDIRLPEAALILVAAILASLGFTIAAYQSFEQHSLSRFEEVGVWGGAIGFFASACAVCQPLWIAWLGLGSVTAFLADYSIYIVAASIALMLYALNSAFHAVVQCRPARRRRK